MKHRFEAERFDGFVVVRKEAITADEHRLLLGKPTPCVGREQELFRIESVYRQCIDESIPQVLLVTAPPGAGKSRLRHEFTRHPKSEVPTILTAFGDPLVVGSPYGLLRRAILERAGIAGAAVVDNASVDEIEARFLNELCKHVAPVDRPRVSIFLGELCDVHFSDERDPALRAARMDPKLMSEQIEHAFLDWLSAECKNAPIVLVLEDVHWGDGPTIRLVDAAMRLQDTSLFVLALARPEVHDVFRGSGAQRGEAKAWAAREDAKGHMCACGCGGRIRVTARQFKTAVLHHLGRVSRDALEGSPGGKVAAARFRHGGRQG